MKYKELENLNILVSCMYCVVNMILYLQIVWLSMDLAPSQGLNSDDEVGDETRNGTNEKFLLRFCDAFCDTCR